LGVTDRPAEPLQATPTLIRQAPRRIIAAAAILVGTVWLTFVLVDVLDVGGIGSGSRFPFWMSLQLFNVVLWFQWLLLAATIVTGAFLGGQLQIRGATGPARFCAWMAGGAGLMMFGATEQLRNRVEGDTVTAIGQQEASTVAAALVDGVHFLGFLSVSAVGLLAFGKFVGRGAPRLATLGLGLFAIAAAGSVLSHINGLFAGAGRLLVGDGVAVGPFPDQLDAHHHVVVTVIGHALVLMGAALILAAVLSAPADAPEGSRIVESPRWPRPFAMAPSTVVTVAGLMVVQVGLVVYLTDIHGLVGIETMAWTRVYNDGPVEWLANVLLIGVCLGSSYLAGRLFAASDRLWLFFWWLGLGTSIMLIEDLGDVRHSLRYALTPSGEAEIAGQSLQTFVDLPVFALIAAAPLWALVRHGPKAWEVRPARPLLVSAYGLYAVAGGVSGIGRVDDLYERAGRAFDDLLLGGRLPVPEEWGQSVAHFNLIDGPVEESIELMAAAGFLGLVLKVAALRRESRSVEPSDPGPGTVDLGV
jgi:hypothetical protein